MGIASDEESDKSALASVYQNKSKKKPTPTDRSCPQEELLTLSPVSYNALLIYYQYFVKNSVGQAFVTTLPVSNHKGVGSGR